MSCDAELSAPTPSTGSDRLGEARSVFWKSFFLVKREFGNEGSVYNSVTAGKNQTATVEKQWEGTVLKLFTAACLVSPHLRQPLGDQILKPLLPDQAEDLPTQLKSSEGKADRLTTPG